MATRRRSKPTRKSSSRKPVRKAARQAARARRPSRRAKPGAAAPPTFPFGAVSHTEISSWDPAGTQAFLQEAFGWEFQAMPGPMPYAVGRAAGFPGGGIRPLMDGEAVPSCTPYLTVKNLAATLGAVELHGGKVTLPPSPVKGQGWFFLFQAPGGPVLGCWQDDPKAPAPKA